MSSKTVSRSVGVRALTALAATAALGASATGTATAAPRANPTEDAYATTVLLGQDGSVVAFPTVTSADGAPLVADLDVFVQGYLCRPTTDPTVTLSWLESATVTGDPLPVTCTYQQDPEFPGEPREDVTGTLSVDLTWAAVGEAEHRWLNGNLDHCVGLVLDQPAQVTGELTLEVAALEVETTLTGGDGLDSWLRYERVNCPPRRG